jgi:hypothetical protein
MKSSAAKDLYSSKGYTTKNEGGFTRAWFNKAFDTNSSPELGVQLARTSKGHKN